MTSQHRHNKSAVACLLWVALAFSASGCASRAYVAPIDGPSATIKYRLVSPVPEARVSTIANGQCAQRQSIGGLKTGASPRDKLQPELTASVPAHRPFYTEVALLVSNATYCGVNWQFQPENGVSYEADLIYANEKCDVKLYKIDAVTMQRTELPSPPVPCK